MKVEKLDHVVILVRDLDEAIRFFSELFETEFTIVGDFKFADVKSAIDPLGIELAQPLTPDGSAAKRLERNGEGLADIALKVENLEKAMAEMESRGIRVVAKLDLGSVKEAVLHPKDTHGVMIALTEYTVEDPVATLRALLPQDRDSGDR